MEREEGLFCIETLRTSDLARLNTGYEGWGDDLHFGIIGT
jgi:hypothetical protein